MLLLIVFVWWPTFATAQTAWMVFSERCLMPMQAGEMPITDDLSAIPAPWELESFVFFESPLGNGPLAVASNGSRCILWDDKSELEPGAFKEWAFAQMEAERYVHFDWNDMSHAPITLDSTHWRTPKLRVQMYWFRIYDDVPVFSVEEITDAS